MISHDLMFCFFEGTRAMIYLCLLLLCYCDGGQIGAFHHELALV